MSKIPSDLSDPIKVCPTNPNTFTASMLFVEAG